VESKRKTVSFGANSKETGTGKRGKIFWEVNVTKGDGDGKLPRFLRGGKIKH